jgi:hypothetical protein
MKFCLSFFQSFDMNDKPILIYRERNVVHETHCREWTKCGLELLCRDGWDRVAPGWPRYSEISQRRRCKRCMRGAK